MKRISIDIESLSLAHNALVLSIGAVVFCPQTGLGREYYVVLNGKEQSKRDIDFSTVQWWIRLAQESPVAADLFAATPQSVPQALSDLAQFISPEDEVWARGPQFDIVALESLYREHGMRPPWDYSMVRDQRTYCAGQPAVPFVGTAHNALADAKHQARAIMNVMIATGVE